MIDRSHALPLTRQVELLAISRGSIYYERKNVDTLDLEIMRIIDELIWNIRLPARECFAACCVIAASPSGGAT